MSENQKKIWVTGASSGIGKAVAEKFAHEGWKVAVSARRKELLDEMAKNDGGRATPSMFAVNNDRAVPLEVRFNQARKVDEHVAELGHLCGRHK